MSETTARHALPLLAAGQAQKEMTHNEALAVIDLAVAPSVVAAGLTTPPDDPALGACWIVGAGATGAWAGAADAIAGWTDGGWRFVRARVGMLVWVEQAGRYARYSDSGWNIGAPLGTPAAAIPAPVAGATIDVEARAAIAAILSALQGVGITAAP
jgi:hypothetical protein